VIGIDTNVLVRYIAQDDVVSLAAQRPSLRKNAVQPRRVSSGWSYS